MKILTVILQNLNNGPVTLRYPARVPPPTQLRGLLELDAGRCAGCGTCAYVCSPGAIQVVEMDQAFEWVYDPGLCTFCGRCVQDCPLAALSMQAERPPVYFERQALKQVVRQEYPFCPSCGRPTRPVNQFVMQRAYPEISPQVNEFSRLCPACRQATLPSVLVRSGK